MLNLGRIPIQFRRRGPKPFANLGRIVSVRQMQPVMVEMHSKAMKTWPPSNNLGGREDMKGHDCIGSACAICHVKCECHDCTQARTREKNPFQPLFPPGTLNPTYVNPWNCSASCCQPGYIGDCFCTHRRATL